jgi:hypothetical protein
MLNIENLGLWPDWGAEATGVDGLGLNPQKILVLEFFESALTLNKQSIFFLGEGSS